MKITCRMFLILAVLALCSAEPYSVNRIANGKLATPGQFPYMVSLQQLGDPQSEQTRGHRCSGALISYRHVVTTAVCLYNYTTSPPQVINKNQFRVFAGSNVLNNDISADFIRPIQNLTVHPFFSESGLVNNIAIITLGSAFLRGIVSPLLLPNLNFNPGESALCTVAGWGNVNKTSGISVDLRFETKYVYNESLCTAAYNNTNGSKNILPSMICAMFHDSETSNCLGDFGNPLVCDKTFTGILSSSNNCSISTLPEIYTRISSYNSWIIAVSGAPTLINPGILALLLLTFMTSLF